MGLSVSSRPLVRGVKLITAAVWAILVVPPAVAQQPPAATGLEAARAMEQVLVKAIAKAEKSVVAIARVRRPEPGRPAGGQEIDPRNPDFVPNEYATGVVVGQDGLILTNYHVLGDVKRNDYYVWVAGRPFQAVEARPVEKAVAGDPWTDLAVLKIKADNLQPIEFGDATKLKKGMIVVAMGNPHAIARDGQPSASWGIVSNLSRRAPAPAGDDERQPQAKTLHEFGSLIQTDARLNQGTSGGALLNLDGQMIGLTTALAALTGHERAAGFAIPVDDVFEKTVQKLMDGRVPEFGFLGVAPRHLSLPRRQQGQWGAELLEVVSGTPAHHAGLRRGDVVTHVNRRPIRDRNALFHEVSRLPAQATVELTVLRDRTVVRRQVKLAKKFTEHAGPAFSQVPKRVWRGIRVDFATAMPPDLLPRQGRPVDATACVAVVEVVQDSLAWQAGVRPGDYVDQVDDRRVTEPDAFYNAVADKTQPVRLHMAGVVGDEAVRVVSPMVEPPKSRDGDANRR